MPVIHHLLQRLGFVKLDRFGLELTAEGRILSRRPEVLDDGMGGRVVGWEDGDLAMAELSAWQPGVRSLPAPAPRQAQTMAIPPVISGTSSVVAGASAGVMPAPVAPAVVVDEDDWEWTIALARARASDETTRPVPRQRVSTRPIAVVAVRDPSTSGEWPKTAPIGEIDYDSRPIVMIPRATPIPAKLAATAPATRVPPARLPTAPPVAARPPTAPLRPLVNRPPTAPPVPRAEAATRVLPSVPRAQARTEPVLPLITPSTIIPVPKLPSVHGSQASRLEPVVRTAGPRRFPKGTVGGATTASMTAMSEDTVPNLAVGDRTQVGVAMPPAARAVELPSGKRASRR
jgi:hypothetical protein